MVDSVREGQHSLVLRGLVVVLNLSYEALPSKNAVDTALELVDASIVNVSLTRCRRLQNTRVRCGVADDLMSLISLARADQSTLGAELCGTCVLWPRWRWMTGGLHDWVLHPGVEVARNRTPYLSLLSVWPVVVVPQVSTDIAHDFEHPTDLYPE
ncbi:hypothetical protein HaLaN_10870 [Haematococcus lacustris]|uniref:Uncharacterized protein n=1 Tax=Haematococcus lacustris TaxID=44745 RepID=A0A699Z600_HAELA|nr:hypothetical protein HaLaN_10870 [Haematococcus lacustris]